MKKIFLLMVLFAASFAGYSQTIDSTKCGYVVKIAPVKAKYTDSLNSEYLKAVIVGDDMIKSGTFYYQLLDKNCNCTVSGNVNITNGDYQNWTGSSEEAYIYIANKVGVTIKED